jgi:hypothetical protein
MITCTCGHTVDNGYPHPAWKIKEHFGVEE